MALPKSDADSLKAAFQALNTAIGTVKSSLTTLSGTVAGKLTKPTTPTADSVVTITAAGVVGTMPKSDLGTGTGGSGTTTLTAGQLNSL